MKKCSYSDEYIPNFPPKCNKGNPCDACTEKWQSQVTKAVDFITSTETWKNKEMSDINCPYCGTGLEICHDDGFGYDEDARHEMECYECEKKFIFMTSISFFYEPFKADCLNGKEHNLEPVTSSAMYSYPDWVKCTDCDYENRGKYVPLEKE